MSFTAVVVVHDSAAHLRALLASVQRHLATPPQLVVVDSGSRDDGPAIARAHGAQVVTLDGNPGFGAGSNAGLRHAAHEVTILLNPDCRLVDDSLARLAALAAGRDALLAPRLLNADRTPQRSAHPLPGRPAALLPALVPARILPRHTREAFEPWRARESARRVGWAVAACLAARTDLLRRLGPFDPSAFLFYEDLDLCLRARAAGIPTEWRPEATVIHAGGHATRRTYAGEAFDAQAARRREVVGARLGPRAVALDDAAQALTFAARAAAGRERARNTAALRSLRRARAG